MLSHSLLRQQHLKRRTIGQFRTAGGQQHVTFSVLLMGSCDDHEEGRGSPRPQCHDHLGSPATSGPCSSADFSSHPGNALYYSELQGTAQPREVSSGYWVSSTHLIGPAQQTPIHNIHHHVSWEEESEPQNFMTPCDLQ